MQQVVFRLARWVCLKIGDLSIPIGSHHFPHEKVCFTSGLPGHVILVNVRKDFRNVVLAGQKWAPMIQEVGAPKSSGLKHHCSHLGVSINADTPKMDIRENPIKMDDLRVPPSMETLICS